MDKLVLFLGFLGRLFSAAAMFCMPHMGFVSDIIINVTISWINEALKCENMLKLLMRVNHLDIVE